MAHNTKIGKDRVNGFTLMELLVVLLLIALLASIVTPIVTKSITRAKESTLKENLFIMRKAIDDYYADHGSYPEELMVLVEKRYVRKVPEDPITESKQSWVFERFDSTDGVSGIRDLRSGSDKISSDEIPYSEW